MDLFKKAQEDEYKQALANIDRDKEAQKASLRSQLVHTSERCNEIKQQASQMKDEKDSR